VNAKPDLTSAGFADHDVFDAKNIGVTEFMYAD
jgi:hypothetical protein